MNSKLKFQSHLKAVCKTAIQKAKAFSRIAMYLENHYYVKTLIKSWKGEHFRFTLNYVFLPCVEIGESFHYLGRYFDFDMLNTVHERELSHTVTDLMYKIDHFPLHPRFKFQFYNCYLLPKTLWHLTVADLAKIWASKNFDNQSFK